MDQFDFLVKRFSFFKTSVIIFCAIILDIVITAIFSFILFPGNNSGPEFEITLADALMVIILGPIIETTIFQFLLLKYSLKYISNNKLIALLISTIPFGLAHYYSIAYILKATLSGFIYGMVWLAISDKQKNPFFYVFLTHGIYNGIGFLINAFS